MSRRQRNQHQVREQQGESAKGPESRESLRSVARLTTELALHLVDCWPVRGQPPPVAGPPTQITFANLETYLTDLGRNLASILAPADHTTYNTWLKRTAGLLTSEMREAVSKIKLVCDHLAKQFGSHAMWCGARGYWSPIPSVSIETCSPWQPLDGRPMPEIDPPDIGALAWGAVELFHGLGEPDQAKLAQAILRWVIAEQENNRNKIPPENVHNRKIPPERRTIPLCLKQAARLMGFTQHHSPKKSVEMLSESIRTGDTLAEKQTRQRYIFDRYQFPKEVWSELLP
jgi:hypothetical protein